MIPHLLKTIPLGVMWTHLDIRMAFFFLRRVVWGLGGTAWRGNFLELLKLDSHILGRNRAVKFARKFHVVVFVPRGAHEVAVEMASRRVRS